MVDGRKDPKQNLATTTKNNEKLNWDEWKAAINKVFALIYTTTVLLLVTNNLVKYM
jgi:hypothetical protein